MVDARQERERGRRQPDDRSRHERGANPMTNGVNGAMVTGAWREIGLPAYRALT
jgi:hypothetical protein